MSYTRSSVARTTRQGRVEGPGAGRSGGGQPGAMGRGQAGGTVAQTPAQTNTPPRGEGSQMNDRMRVNGAYTVFAPTEKNRSKFAEQARKGEESFAHYRENRKVGHVSYTGTVGGAEVTEDKARKRQQMNQSVVRKRMQAEERRQELKSQEEVELRRKKDEARKKTEQNLKREQEEDRSRDEKHRKNKEAWLTKLEQASRPSK